MKRFTRTPSGLSFTAGGSLAPPGRILLERLVLYKSEPQVYK